MKKTVQLTIIAAWLCMSALSAQTVPTVFASGFSQGLTGIEIDDQGNVWVTENGTGNDDGRITIIDPEGNQQLFMTGLPSTFIQATGEVVGSYRTIQRPDNKVLVIVGEGSSDLSETLLIVDKTDFVPGTPLTLDDVEKIIHHGDYVHAQGFVQSNPFHVDWDAEGNMYIADSGANSVVRWDAATETHSIVKTLDRFPNPLPFGPPMVDPVPTKVLVKADGSFYISQLTGFPFIQGAANVYNLDAANNMSVYASGFSCLTDMAFDPSDDNLCVLQYGVFGEVGEALNFILGTASVVKIFPNGTRQTIAESIGGLAPSFTFDAAGNLYVVDLVFGQVLKYDIVSSTSEAVIASASTRVYPNPTADGVNITYTLAQGAPISVGIYDLSGRLVAQMNPGEQLAGTYDLRWDGTHASGGKAPAGSYIYRLTAGKSLVSGLIQKL